MNIDIMEKVAAVGSRLEKERLLAQLDKESIKFLVWALDPIITFGVTSDFKNPPYDGTATLPHDYFWEAMDRLLMDLSKRKFTGNAAQTKIEVTLLHAPTDLDFIWAQRIINKDLRAGFSESTLNNVFPGTIEPFACSLAKPYDPDKHELKGAWCVEPKLDGLRMVVLDGVAYTRNGRTIETVGHILKDLEEFKNEYVFDGEIMGKTEFNEDSGKIRKKGTGENKDLVYNVFDCIRRDEWLSKKTRSLDDRKSDLLRAIGLKGIGENIKLVDHVIIDDATTEELFKARDKFIKKGYEGAMVKQLSSPYVFKRSDSLLKLKTVLDADGVIVSAFEGKGRLKGKLGGFSVNFDGVVTDVGSGFSDATRAEFWADRKEMIGRVIEVKYQEKAPSGALRFPVYIKMRPDRDERKNV